MGLKKYGIHRWCSLIIAHLWLDFSIAVGRQLDLNLHKPYQETNYGKLTAVQATAEPSKLD
jgi:hypothetical protein